MAIRPGNCSGARVRQYGGVQAVIAEPFPQSFRRGLEEAGIPRAWSTGHRWPDVGTCCQARRDQVVSFKGSTTVGKLVNQNAAPASRKCT